MKNLKLGLRLGLGFGVMIAMIVLVSVVSVSRLAEQNRTADEIINSQYPQVNAVQTIAYLVMDRARLTRNLIIQNDAARRVADKVAMGRNRVQISEQMAVLDKMVASDEGRQLLKAVAAARAEYAPFTDDVVALAMQGKRDDAVALLYGERYATQGAYLAALSSMLKFLEGGMAEGGKHAENVYAQASMVVIGVAALAALVGMGLAYGVTHSITMPLREAVAATDRVAHGDLSMPIVVTSRDETGLLLSALQRMQHNLVATVSKVRSSSDSVALASGEIAQGNQDLSSRTERQASALEETAASMEQLGATVRQNADSTQQANQLAQRASGLVVRGGAVVAQVVGTMKGINEASKRIADITSVIDSIAFQTNILALNAAVEAARAGEQGRGFAVVASEVRILAGRCADAAKEIKSLINTSVERVAQGTTLVDTAGNTMDEVVDAIRKLSDIVAEISAASTEQATGVAQVGEAVTQMDQATQQNAALVEEMAAAASSLNNQSHELVQAVAAFNLGPQRQVAQSHIVATLGSAVPKGKVSQRQNLPRYAATAALAS